MYIKLPATWLFVQNFVQLKKNKKRTTQYWSFLDKSTGCRRLPSLRDSKADSVPWYCNQQELSAHFFQYSDYTWLFLTVENNML